MAENLNKKLETTMPENAPAAKVEQISDIVKLEQANQAEQMLTAATDRKLMVQKEGEILKNGLEKRVDELPTELKGEAASIKKAARAEIAQNTAELDALANELENLWFAEGQGQGGGGPLPVETATEAPEKKLERKIDEVLGPSSNFEQTDGKSEADKQKEVAAFLEGLKAALSIPSLTDDERAGIQEQIAGLEEAQEAAKENDQSIYQSYEVITEPAAAVSEPDKSDALPRAPDATRVIPAPVETPKTNEQLLAERRMLEREWEKEATKLTEQKMSKDERQQYKELLTGRVVKKAKKGKFTAEERKKFIEDVGFTALDYAQMKAGAKPWTLNAIWKRLGEIDKNIASDGHGGVRRDQREPTSLPDDSIIIPASQSGAPNKIPDASKFKESTERARLLDKMLAKLDADSQERYETILQKMAEDPHSRAVIGEKAKATLETWKKIMDVKEIRQALGSEFGNVEEINKLWAADLEIFRDHFIKNLEASIKLTAEPPTLSPAKIEPSALRAKKESKPKINQPAPVAAEQTNDKPEILPRQAAQETKAPAVDFAKKAEADRLRALEKNRVQWIKEYATLKQAAKRGEKHARKKLKETGVKLANLRKEKRELKK